MTILGFLILVMALWIHDVTTYREILNKIVYEEENREIVASMRYKLIDAQSRYTEWRR